MSACGLRPLPAAPVGWVGPRTASASRRESRRRRRPRGSCVGRGGRRLRGLCRGLRQRPMWQRHTAAVTRPQAGTTSRRDNVVGPEVVPLSATGRTEHAEPRRGLRGATRDRGRGTTCRWPSRRSHVLRQATPQTGAGNRSGQSTEGPAHEADDELDANGRRASLCGGQRTRTGPGDGCPPGRGPSAPRRGDIRPETGAPSAGVREAGMDTASVPGGTAP